jgi:hypothetical protein
MDSEMDNIFALKIVNEKIWEYNNQSVQYIFIDFQQTYDSVRRDTLWKLMEVFKIPTKLINIYKTCVKKKKSAVRMEGTLSSFFENKTGLKEGDDSLSPILFNLAIQKVIQSIQTVSSGIKIGEEQSNVLAYADEIILIGNNETEIRYIFVEMKNAARKLGPQINQEKTKYMIDEMKNSLKQTKTGHLKIKNYKLENVENFK